MKILVIPDKFKNSISSSEAGNAIKEGLSRSNPEYSITSLTLADGGDGFLDAISTRIPVKTLSIKVLDPLFREVETSLSFSKNAELAFIEMAKASGLHMLNQDEIDCNNTTSFGTGQLIRAALELNVQKVILGIGGSATNDGGMGMAAALGYRFIDSKGNPLSPVGKNLINVAQIDSSAALDISTVKFLVACDVKNPLLGPNGATYTFAPQKGATNKDLEFLETGMRNFAQILKTDLGKDIKDVEGSGAAGGMGAAAIAFLNADLVSGTALMLELTQAEQHIKEADVVITAEGRFDAQSLNGKLISGIAALCKTYNKPLYILCGSFDIHPDTFSDYGITSVHSINPPDEDINDSMINSRINLEEAARQLGLGLKVLI